MPGSITRSCLVKFGMLPSATARVWRTCAEEFGKDTRIQSQREGAARSRDPKVNIARRRLFPTCQVRVVRFYVSLFSRTPSPSPPPPVVLLLVGSQLRSCEFSVACWTPTAILRVQCGVPDPNRDPASSVWRAGPQL